METIENRTKQDILDDIKKSEDNIMKLFKAIKKERDKIIELTEELEKIEEEKQEIMPKDINKTQSSNGDKKISKRGRQNSNLQCTGGAYADADTWHGYSYSENYLWENEAVAQSVAIGWCASSYANAWLHCECKDCNNNEDKCYCCVCKCRPMPNRCRRQRS